MHNLLGFEVRTGSVLPRTSRGARDAGVANTPRVLRRAMLLFRPCTCSTVPSPCTRFRPEQVHVWAVQTQALHKQPCVSRKQVLVDPEATRSRAE